MTKTYEQRLCEIAEEMAKAKTPKIYEMKLSQSQRDNLISSYLPLAAIALKHMAEEHTRGLLDYVQDGIGTTLQQHLINRGLIQPQKP